ncbi:MAG: hypothetical protein QOH03_5007, partial [Kribbellaceae bacterium]|nr:hypothetical protein [Kribbellaceae bacterium]
DVAIREKVAEMGEAARVIAERVHQIVRGVAPELTPRLYYGMPAYAIDGKVVCFFQPAAKFKTRYPTFGFNDSAQLDDGDIWPTGFAVATMSAAVEERLTALVSRAVGR